MESPTIAKIMVTESNREYWRIAEIMPKGMPSRIAITMDKAASLMVDGKAERISSDTGRRVM